MLETLVAVLREHGDGVAPILVLEGPGGSGATHVKEVHAEHLAVSFCDVGWSGTGASEITELAILMKSSLPR